MDEPETGRAVHQTFSDLVAAVPVDDSRHRFQIVPAAGDGFLYAGLTMAASLTAAAATVGDGLVPMSLRAAFLSFGQWATLDAEVAHVQDSRAFARRTVALSQGGGRPIVTADIAFHRPESGTDSQSAGAPTVTGPDGLATISTPLGGTEVLDLRPVGPGASENERLHPYWVCVRENLPADDAALNAAGLAFASDYGVIYTPFAAGSGDANGVESYTLEHSLWFHRPFSAHDWLLFDAAPLTVSFGRYVTRGSVYDRAGALVASFVQEGFIRARRDQT
jgi:acyl-CoA thioesterase-2